MRYIGQPEVKPTEAKLFGIRRVQATRHVHWEKKLGFDVILETRKEARQANFFLFQEEIDK